MNSYLVLTVISDDKPGVVEQLAQTIGDNGGNWLESRMSHLAGKFAGIVQVAVAEEHRESLQQALLALAEKGLKIVVETATDIEAAASRAFEFSVVGGDRPGIVREIAQAFASRRINMTDLETHCSSMPWSGEPLFEATGVIQVPETVDMEELQDQLDGIADQLAVDIRIEEGEAKGNN